jgi:ABC-type antimicrobial peptide transport system permease subunit
MNIGRRILAAILLGVPAGYILAVLSTPLLWKLEAILQIELAGHSGPADWIFWVSVTLCSCVAFALFQRDSREKK